MPRTVPDAFNYLFRRVAPLSSETDARRRHRITITQGVRLCYPEHNRVEIFGSHARDTAIRYWSDVDYLAILRQADVQWGERRTSSATVLQNIRDGMRTRFRNTQVDVRAPAVVIHFGGGEGSVDVVPGIWLRTISSTDGYPVFGIPDTAGGWLVTSPQRHQRFILDRSYGRLPKLMQLIKAWKYSRESPVPFSTIHVELVIAAGNHCNRAGTTYRRQFVEVLHRLVMRNGSALPDPIRVGSAIPLASTPAKIHDVLIQIRYALAHGRAALRAEEGGDIPEAYRQWRLVFRGLFPAFT